MRWPTVPAPDGKGEMIDQDAVNELVDYAIAHGVNYFDTSPMYVQGWSEKSTGIALKRHPRESFYLATKLSNFHPDTWTREGSIAMYRKSFEDMQVDYIDYYLLHMIGGGGMEQFRKRYIDNGMIDFLVKEREAGRIRRLGWSFHGDIEVYDYALQMHDRGEVHWDFVQIQLNYVDWKHASGSNFKAEYLYDELAKRKIPAVIMEPLLGGRLSMGERQRIGLARAFLSGCPLILLDEPTSNVDSINEGVILRALLKHRQGRTIILVSHRASTMAVADRVYKMENGQMEEQAI